MLVSEITAFLENAYEVLNERFFDGELSKVVITIQSSPRAYGHYTPWDAWSENQQGYREINISAETLNRPVGNVIATLVHEMVHHYCDMKGIKDTSRSNVYHNKRFKNEAESRGLVLDYDNRIGFSITHPSLMLMDLINSMGWENVNLARNGGNSSSNGSGGSDNGSGGVTTGKPKSSTRKYICTSCGCSVRATKVVNIGCLDCGTVMVVEEK
ncbi:MAG: SprT-like domain-containing protein [Anaerovorax sp.]|nr:SprT-like domain-containing protein [Anaerovorax sp.]